MDDLQNYDASQYLNNPLAAGGCYVAIHMDAHGSGHSFPPSVFMTQHEFTHLCYLPAFWMRFVSGPVLIY